MKIAKEDFEAWLANPVTEWVHRGLEKFAAEALAEWIALSWDGNNPDPLQLRDLKARHSVALDLKNWKLEDIEELLDDGTGSKDVASPAGE